ncbi:hypothetical protein ACFLSV_02620 [Bacteroidota bacterium]
MKKTNIFSSIAISLLILFTSSDSFSQIVGISCKAKKFVEEHYDINRQREVQNILINILDNDMIYNEGYFTLDTMYTDKFYEEIAIFDQYIFGWDDWYEKYAEYGIRWAWSTNEYDTNHLWYGNYTTHPDFEGSVNFDPPQSKNKDIYYKMVSDYFLFDG